MSEVKWYKCIKTHPWYKKGNYYKTDGNSLIMSDVKGCYFNNYEGQGSIVQRYFQKLFTLQDLRNGKCAVEKDIKHINNILLHASGKNVHQNYIPCKYYYRGSEHDAQYWHGSNSTNLPIQKASDFLIQIEKKEPLKILTPFPNPIEPNHYGGSENPLEAIKIIQHYNLSFELGNVLKYILRHDKKGSSLDDLNKAKRYLEYEISKYN